MLSAIFELLALLKRQDDTTIVFVTKSLTTPSSWTPTVWDQLTIVNVSPTVADFETQFVAKFFQSFAVDGCAEKDWKLLQQQLTAESNRVKHHFDAFLNSICASAAASKRPTVVLDSVPTVLTGEFELSSDDNATSLPDSDMQRIASQLVEYNALRHTRQQTRRRLERIRARRDAARPFARRLRVIAAAEEKLRALDASVSLSLLAVVESLRDCTECASREPFYSEFTQRQEVLGPAREDDEPAALSKHDAESLASLSSLVHHATEFVTVRYIAKRLGGLPARLHVTFVFLVALAAAEDDSEEHVDAFALVDAVEPRQFQACDASARSSPYCFVACSSEPPRKEIVRQLARHTVAALSEVALRSVCHGLLDSASAANRSRVAHLELGPRLAYARILSKLLARSSLTQRTRQLADELLDDMLAHPEAWRAYLSQPWLMSSPSSTTHGRVPSATVSYLPWTAQRLTPVERLLLQVCVFDTLPTVALHDFVKSQLGDALLLDLSARIDSELKRGLASVAQSGVFSTPLLLVSDPTRQGTTALSRLLECAHQLSVREDALSCISMGSVTSVPGFRLAEFSHCNLLANAHAMHYVDAVKRLHGIKERSLGGGWVVVKDTRLGEPAARSALRQQVETMKKVHANKSSDFRLWILCELSSSSSYGAHSVPVCSDTMVASVSKSDNDDEFLAQLPGERKFAETPQTLAHQYVVAVGQGEDKAAAHVRKPQPHQPHAPPRRPQLITRRSSFSAAQAAHSAVVPCPTDTSAEQWWVRAALWLFHAVFRQHLALSDAHDEGGSGERTSACNNNDVVPCEMLVSHLELERALQLIQLHTHHKAVATSASSVALGSGSPASTDWRGATASTPSAEVHMIVELATMVYMGRQSSDSRSRQCRELLEWCLAPKNSLRRHSSTNDMTIGGEAAVTHLRSHLIHLRESIFHKQLDTSASIAGSGSSSSLECACLPLQLQFERESRSSRELITVLRSSATHSVARGVSPPPRSLRRELTAAQRVLRHVVSRFPDKMSLSSGIEQQRIQRRTSLFAAYRRGTRMGVGASVQPVAPTHSDTSVVDSVSTPWRRAVLAHLTDVELPAMEAYLQSVWRMSDAILSLRPNSHDAPVVSMSLLSSASASVSAHYQETVAVFNALGSGRTPTPWRSFTSSHHTELPFPSAAGYATPARLNDWVDWFCRSVAFYQRVQLQPTHLVDVVWVSGLQYPKGRLGPVWGALGEWVPSRSLTVASVLCRVQRSCLRCARVSQRRTASRSRTCRCRCRLLPATDKPSPQPRSHQSPSLGSSLRCGHPLLMLLG